MSTREVTTRRGVLAAWGAAVLLFVVAIATALALDRPTVVKPIEAAPPSNRTVPSAQATEPSVTASHWPGSHNTGVPDGVELKNYESSCTLTTPGQVIDSRIFDCEVLVRAPGVHITRSRMGRVDVDGPDASVVIEDSSIDGGEYYGPAVGLGRFTLRRVEVVGAQHGAMCSASCLVEDSWLHDQYLPPDQPWHLNAVISNGGSDIVIRHSTLSCDPPVNAADGGCTADVSFFGDFSPISDVLVERNLLRATPGGFCGSFGHNPQKPFGTDPARVVVRDNVFEKGVDGKCGVFGAATSFLATGQGNEWVGNRWDDGSPMGLP
jgi:hypothetical protein